MNVKKIAALILTGVMICLLAGCGGSAADDAVDDKVEEAVPEDTGSKEAAAASEAEGIKQKVGIAMPSQSPDRWRREGSYLETQFQAAGYETATVWSDNDASKQTSDIRKLITDHVDLLVIAPVDGESLAEVLEEAEEADIPVISYDGLIMNTDAVNWYVSFDCYAAGTLQGQFVVDALGLSLDDTSKTYNIEITAGDPDDSNSGLTFNGAYDVLSPYIEAGILAVPSGDTTFSRTAIPEGSQETALERMQGILASYYADGMILDAVLCLNDAAAGGVSQAIESSYTGDNTVIITGCGGDEASLADIIDGKQSMTVFDMTANEAEVTLDLGLAILNGETPDAALIDNTEWGFDCTYDTVSYDNGMGIIPSYLLTPTVITNDNLQTGLVDTGYYTLDGDYPKAVG